MSDIVLILTGAISIVTLLLIVLIVWKGVFKAEEKPSQPRAVPLNRNEGPPAAPGRRRRNVRARMREGMTHGIDDDDEDEDPVPLEDRIAMPEGKVGAKKLKKLEMKAEKRAQRERDLQDREEKKQRQEKLEEQRKLEEHREKEEEARKLEEEKRLKEEKEKQEYEEYLMMKEAFSVEDEGFDAADEEVSQNKLQEFINYVKTEKVVLLEDLAAKYQLKTQDCIDRIQDLLAQETLVGVIDDRGKFIYITKEELEEVARFIRQRGRVSISELVESSNSLINLNVKASA